MAPKCSSQNLTLRTSSTRLNVYQPVYLQSHEPAEQHVVVPPKGPEERAAPHRVDATVRLPVRVEKDRPDVSIAKCHPRPLIVSFRKERSQGGKGFGIACLMTFLIFSARCLWGHSTTPAIQ